MIVIVSDLLLQNALVNKLKKLTFSKSLPYHCIAHLNFFSVSIGASHGQRSS